MRLYRNFFIIPFFLLCIALSGCASKKTTPEYAGPPCQDVLNLPQDLNVYATANGLERMLATPEEQAAAAERQKRNFYRPWRVTKASAWIKQSLDKNFNMNPQKGYTKDERPFSEALWNEIVDNSNKAAYPSLQGPAITLRHTNLRAMPTREHYYLRPELPGEGYPFDYFQHSSLAAGTPVYICNASKDGQWLLVDSPITAGWIPAGDAVAVDSQFMERWQSLPLAAVVRDKTLINGETVHIGTLLPLSGYAPKGRGQALSVYFPKQKASGRADMTVVSLPPDTAVAVPLPLTPMEVAKVGNEMMGQAYSWGGLDEKRDCSALTRDLMTPFGIFLPRNSSAQAKAGRGIALAGLSLQEKESAILNQAQPFSSLIWLRGHIGLYAGKYNGKPVMFHNMWGLRIRDAQGGCDGRAIVGKAVVTTLQPGIERPDLCASGSFLERIEQVAVLPADGSAAPIRAAAPAKAVLKADAAKGETEETLKKKSAPSESLGKKKTAEADKKTVEADKEKEKKATGQRFKYVYQAASFKDKASADRYTASLKADGLNARTDKSADNKVTWYRVLLDLTGTTDDADTLRAAMRAKGVPKILMRSKEPVN